MPTNVIDDLSARQEADYRVAFNLSDKVETCDTTSTTRIRNARYDFHCIFQRHIGPTLNVHTIYSVNGVTC